jgi:hypothetical protein
MFPAAVDVPAAEAGPAGHLRLVKRCATQWQPLVTGDDTPEDHDFSMRRSDHKKQGVTTATAEALPELKPGREAGWIFRDDDCFVIERQGQETRARVPGD